MQVLSSFELPTWWMQLFVKRGIMKRSLPFFLFLFILSISFYILNFNIDGFQFSKIHYHLYFLAWMSIANLILCLILAYAVFVIYKLTNLIPLRFIPLALLFYSFGIIINCFHLSYCKICSDLGFCGTAHTYPNAISLLSICVSLILYIINQTQVNDLKLILKKLWSILLIGFLVIIVILFISLFYMDLPRPIPYKVGHFNMQGFIFIFISLFCFLSFIMFFYGYIKTHSKVLKGVSVQFVVTGLLQLISAYHITTCYWCNVEECSEFFSLSGIFILIAMFILWYSYMPLLYCEALSKKTQTSGVSGHAKQCSDKDAERFPDGFFFARPFAVPFSEFFNVAYVEKTCTI